MIPFVAVLAAVAFCDPTALGRQAVLDGDHVLAAQLLGPGTGRRGTEADLWRLYAAVHENRTADAKAALRRLDDSFIVLPRRHAELVERAREAVAKWADGDLADVGRDMGRVRTRLASGRAGTDVQADQQRIIAKLDRLIREQEEGKNAAAGAKGQDDDRDAKSQPGREQSPTPSQPATDSTPAGTAGAGQTDAAAMRRYAATWGTMPAATRARVIQDITRDVPPKYRELVESYRKAINDTGRTAK